MGWYRSSANNITYSAGNNQVLTIGATAMVSGNPYRAPNGTTSACAFSFTSNISTGLIRPTNNILGFCANSINSCNVSAQGLQLAIDGDINNPVIHWINNLGMGFYRKANNTLAITISGGEVCNFNNTNGLTMNNNINVLAHNTFNIGASTISSFKDAYVVNGVTTGSDEKIKKDVIDCCHGLETVIKLRPVEYKYNDDYSGGDDKLHMGLIANEVDTIFNNDTKQYKFINKESEIMGLNYSELIPILIKAIQELNKKIEILENKNNI